MIRRTSIFALAIAIAAVIAPAGSAAAPAAPGWTLTIVPMPANFAPGESSEFVVMATNVGGAPTAGAPSVLQATIPDGLTITRVGSVNSDRHAAADPSCTIASQAITCETAEAVGPSRFLNVEIEFEVSLAAPEESLEAQATVSGGGAAQAVSASARAAVQSDPVPFGFTAGLRAPALNADASPATAANSHPYQQNLDFGFPVLRTHSESGIPLFANSGHLRDTLIDLPRGMIVNPAATPVLCTEAQLTGSERCPDGSQVGVFDLTTLLGPGTGTFPIALYNMVPPPGVPAALGFDAANVGIYIHILGGVRTDGDFGLEAVVHDALALGSNPIFNLYTQLWGDPSAAAHNEIRGKCLSSSSTAAPCAVTPQSTAFLTMPSDCPGAPTTMEVAANSWEDSDVFHKAPYESADLEGNPVSVDGCNGLKFEPTITSQPTTNLAESPSGLDFHLRQPQDFDLEDRSSAALKNVTIALPQGMTLNPAAADGIAGCSSSQIGLLTAIGQSPVHFNRELPSCPDASKLGTVEVSSPVLARHDSEEKVEIDPETGEPIPEPLVGSIYLAKPFENPFNSLLAVYLALEDKKTGIVAKVPGEITADPSTGQLVTHFEESPELPLEDVHAFFFGGARAPLITPPLCGNHTTTAIATPWSSPEGVDVKTSDSFATSAFPGGGGCPTSAGAAPNNPAFSAGTIDPVAGAYSPFVIKLNRNDGSQRLTGVDTTLPPGLIGKLAGLTQCSEAQIAAAKAREASKQGALEKASPSCPAASEVGTIDVSGGAGPTPIHVQGRVYIAGPYKGAPLSVAIITPAIAGPFDLGAVVVRAALYVDSKSAQIHAVSDPFPQTLEGIPLDVRGAALKLDRPSFTLNPTSCDPMRIIGNAITTTGQSAALSNPFQVGGCSSLGFKPKLALKLKGGTKRGGHPALEAIYKPRPGDANVKGLVMRLPRSAFLDQAHIRTICTRVQYAAKACPPGSQYGSIKAWTPLLEEPLSGPVYLRSSDHNLPDLIFDLHGTIDVEVATRIDSVNGGIRASIESAPDAPLSKVVLNMQGAKKGLIVNSRNLCKGANKADVQLDAQNGKVYDLKPELKPSCKKQGHRGHRGKHAH